MSFEARCPQCLFLTRHLAQPTPCLLHVNLAADSEAPADPEPASPSEGSYDEPYAFGQLNPTIDRPGPFSIREYVRLRLLRTRVQEARAAEAMATSVPS